MDWFQAINHSMTTVATGGFSTEAASIEDFESPRSSGSPSSSWRSVRRPFSSSSACSAGSASILKQNHEVYWFYGLSPRQHCSAHALLGRADGRAPDHDSIRTAAFQATSILTTTGYASTDFDTWLPPAKMLLMILMFIGGCSGSTGGGVKVVRIVVALRSALISVTHAFRPNVTIPMRMSGQTLGERAIFSITLFLMLMAALQILSMLFVSAMEPDLSFLGVFSCVQATLFNIGPGFEAVGPTENFHFLRPSTKTFLSLLMILGRLELYAVLVLFAPSVWKRFS